MIISNKGFSNPDPKMTHAGADILNATTRALDISADQDLTAIGDYRDNLMLMPIEFASFADVRGFSPARV